MNKAEILDTKLHGLMWSGKQYTLCELHRMTGSDKYMTLKSFRNRMAERNLIYSKNGDYYRCVAVIMPAPCELKRRFKSWLSKAMQ